MKSKRLFHIIVLLVWLFNSQPVDASPLAATVNDRILNLWGNNQTGYVNATSYDRWHFTLTEEHHFTVKVTSVVGDLVPMLILLDANGAELTRGLYTLTTTQPAGLYSVQIQPQTGVGYYFLTTEDHPQHLPTVVNAVMPAFISIGGTTTVTVDLINVPAEGYTSVELTCGYYPDLVELKDIFVSDLFGPDPVVAVNSPGDSLFIVAIAGSQGHKATSDGTVLEFTLRGLQPGQSPLECVGRVSTGENTLTQIASMGNNVTVLPNTPTPGTEPTLCDKVQLIADVNVPDGTVFAPGTQFTKTWRLRNVGSCAWTTSYQLVFFSGAQMSGPSASNFSVNVAPGQTVNLSVQLTAPSVAGLYRGYWMFKNADGALFGIGPQANRPWWLEIRVAAPSGTPATPTNSPVPSSTPSPTGTLNAPTASLSPTITPGGPTATPIPGVIYDFAARACTAQWSSGAGPLPCPGLDGDARGFVLLMNHPSLETGATDPRSGLLTFPQNIQNGNIIGRYPPIRIQNGDHFRSTVTCEYGATNCFVAFRLDYLIGSEPVRTLWAFFERYDGQQYNADIDLSSLAGKDVQFILTVLSSGDPAGDRAMWVGPVISRAGTTVTSTPAPASTSTLLASTGTPFPYGTFNGKVFASKLVRIEAYDVSGNLVGAGWVEPDGSFEFGTASGPNTVIAMASGFLSAQHSVIVTDGSTITLPTLNLIAGDIDGNNVIDQFDALTIGMNYNQSVPSVSDLNNDGVINVLDLELLAKNYRKTGPVPW